MLNIVKSSNVGDMISDFLRQSNDLRAEFRTRLLSLGLMQCKSYIVLCGKHVVYMRLPSHKKSKRGLLHRNSRTLTPDACAL